MLASVSASPKIEWLNFFVKSWIMTTLVIGKIAKAIAILKQCIFVAGHRAAALGEGKKLYDQIMDGCGNAMLCISSMQSLGHAQ